MTITTPLGDLIHITSGFAFKSKQFNETHGTPIIRIRDVMKGETSLRFDGDFDERYIVEDNDLLVTMDGEFRVNEWQGGRALLNQRVCRVEPNHDQVDRRFLRHFLPKKLKEIEDRTPFVTVKHLSAKSIREIPFPGLCISEQRRLAKMLDKADGIRRKRERLIEETRDFVRSAYLHTVGHLNPSQGNWESFTIEALAEDRKGAIRSGPFGSALRHGEFVDNGIAVLGIDNAVQNRFAWAERRFITPSKYEELRRYKVFPDDVIVTIMGTTGRSAVVPSDIPEAITTKHLATITCNKDLIHPEVLSFAIHSDPLIIHQIKSFNKGAIMDGLNLGIIRKLEINLPPMEDQRRFVRMLRKARSIEARSQTPEGAGEDLFQSLSQRAFRGEL